MRVPFRPAEELVVARDGKAPRAAREIADGPDAELRRLGGGVMASA